MLTCTKHTIYVDEQFWTCVSMSAFAINCVWKFFYSKTEKNCWWKVKSFRICWVINLWQYQFNSLTIYNSYNCITAAIIIALIIRVVDNSLGTQSNRHGDCKTLMFQSCLILLSSPHVATLAGEKTTKQFNALMIMMYEQLKTTNKSYTCVVLMFPTPPPPILFRLLLLL